MMVSSYPVSSHAVSSADASAPAAICPGTDPGSATPYDRYVGASVLRRLQRPRTADPGERAFLVTTQVMELWFGLVVSEWRAARRALDADRLSPAEDALARSVAAHRALGASWAPIASLTPAEFNAYRQALGAASGFQSAAHRELEFLLGEKSESLLQPYRDLPDVHERLRRELRAPSLYDAVLAFLHRRGLTMPAEVLARDVTARYQPHPDVEAAWVRVYADPEHAPLVRLGELLTDVAEQVMRWRTDHLMATRRAMGAKPGTGGSAGVAWLEKRAAALVFPELWTARGHV